MMDTINIRQATAGDVQTIHRLAHDIWWPTYQDYIPHDQIRLMLELIYDERALLAQLDAGQYFSIAVRSEQPVGFVGFRSKPDDARIMRIEKIYIHPSEQGKGTGVLLIDHVSTAARAQGKMLLELNVNRSNPAKAFYTKQGFVVVEEVDIPYHGYVLNDYIMQKPL